MLRSLHRWKAIPVYLGRLHMALRPFGRADAALPQAHRHQTLPLHWLRPKLFPLRPPGASPTASRHDVKLAPDRPPQPSPPHLLLRRNARPSGGPERCWCPPPVYKHHKGWRDHIVHPSWSDHGHSFLPCFQKPQTHPSTVDLRRHLNACTLAVTWRNYIKGELQAVLLSAKCDDWGRNLSWFFKRKYRIWLEQKIIADRIRR